MQSSQLALDLAARCVASGALRQAVIFLHDANRPLEQRIIQQQLLASPLVRALGVLEELHQRPGGDLAGFLVELLPAGAGQQQQA